MINILIINIYIYSCDLFDVNIYILDSESNEECFSFTM